MTVHLERGCDSGSTCQHLTGRGLTVVIATKGKLAPITTDQRWVVERTNAWTHLRTKLDRCTERWTAVIAFWIAFSAVIITDGRLFRRAWTHYRCATPPARRP